MPPHADDDPQGPTPSWQPPEGPGTGTGTGTGTGAGEPPRPPLPPPPVGSEPSDAPPPPGAPYGPAQGVPYQPYGPPGTGPRRTNRLAIVALVTGLLGLVLLAIGFGIAALVQAGRRGEKGRGLAVGGLVAAGVWSVAAVVAVVLVIGSLVTAERDASGRVTGEDTVLPAALQVGDCFTGFRGDRALGPVTALPCARPHEGEVVAQLSLPGGEYPGDKEVLELATQACYVKTLRTQKSRYVSHLEPYVIPPTSTGWSGGDRKALCLFRYTGSDPLTAPLALTLDPSLKVWSELARGDCLGRWDEEANSQRVLSCAKSHWMQVYAVFPMKAGPYPGEKTAARDAEASCDKLAPKSFVKGWNPDLIWRLYPERFEWEAGIRTVACMAESKGRPLKKSVLAS